MRARALAHIRVGSVWPANGRVLSIITGGGNNYASHPGYPSNYSANYERRRAAWDRLARCAIRENQRLQIVAWTCTFEIQFGACKCVRECVSNKHFYSTKTNLWHCYFVEYFRTLVATSLHSFANSLMMKSSIETINYQLFFTRGGMSTWATKKCEYVWPMVFLIYQAPADWAPVYLNTSLWHWNSSRKYLSNGRRKGCKLNKSYTSYIWITLHARLRLRNNSKHVGVWNVLSNYISR